MHKSQSTEKTGFQSFQYPLLEEECQDSFLIWFSWMHNVYHQDRAETLSDFGPIHTYCRYEYDAINFWRFSLLTNNQLSPEVDMLPFLNPELEMNQQDTHIHWRQVYLN